MNNNKLIIHSIVQAGLTPAEAVARYGLSRRWVYELLRRYRVGGELTLQATSRRPRNNPHTTDPEIAEGIRQLRQALTRQGLGAGAATIVWHLSQTDGRSTTRPSGFQALLRDCIRSRDSRGSSGLVDGRRFVPLTAGPNLEGASDTLNNDLGEVDDEGRYLATVPSQFLRSRRTVCSPMSEVTAILRLVHSIVACA